MVSFLAPRIVRVREVLANAPQPLKLDRLTVRSSIAMTGTHSLLDRLISAQPRALWAPARPFVVLINRSTTRMFIQSEELVEALGGRDAVRVYHGTETVLDTISLFRSARAIVGYHGAGLANAVFARNGTRVIEITTWMGLNSTSPSWRSVASRVAKWGNYTTHIVRVPLANQLAANHEAYRQEDPDHFIKALKWVSLTEQEISQVAQLATGAQ
jgi:hypothetical protein